MSYFVYFLKQKLLKPTLEHLRLMRDSMGFEIFLVFGRSLAIQV